MRRTNTTEHLFLYDALCCREYIYPAFSLEKPPGIQQTKSHVSVLNLAGYRGYAAWRAGTTLARQALSWLKSGLKR